MKCAICKEKVEETFLDKPVGTWIRDAKGKRHLVCARCQRQHDKAGLLAKIS